MITSTTLSDDAGAAAVPGDGAASSAGWSAGCAVALAFPVANRDHARRLAAALQDLIEPPPDALTLFEDPAHGWRIDAYYAATEPPETAAIAAALTDILDFPVDAPSRAIVPDLNWVALSQAALPPVRAGRFAIHGSHDRHRIPQGPGAILIDAGEAFGTAHHATTYGCLLALDLLTRRHRFARVLDLGCGSGVLAIAVARALPHARLIATDRDRRSVEVAAENFRANRLAGRIDPLVADGLAAPSLRRPASFDLLIANILAGPLIRLARPITRATAPGGRIVLSGLLVDQSREVIAAYRAAGCDLECHDRIAGWSTLVMKKRRQLSLDTA